MSLFLCRGLCVGGRVGGAGAASGRPVGTEAPAGASGAVSGAAPEGQPQLSLFSGMVSSDAMQNAFRKARWPSNASVACFHSLIRVVSRCKMLGFLAVTAGGERGALPQPTKRAGGDVGADGEGQG